MKRSAAQSRHLVARLAVTTLLASSAVMLTANAATLPALANGGPTCSRGFYQVSANHFYRFDPASSGYTAVGSATIATGNLNAIGYRAQDNSIYGVVSTVASLSELYRIDSAGAYTDLGAITPPVYQPQGGDFTRTGHLLVYTAADSWFDINVDTLVATPLTPTGLVWDFDRAWDIVIAGDVAYGFSGSVLYKAALTIDGSGVTTAASVSIQVITGSSPRQVHGAAFADSSGALFFFRDLEDRLYSLASPASTTAVLVASLADMPAQSDGASCPAALSPYAAPTTTADTYSAAAGHTFAATAGSTPAGVLDNDVGGSQLRVSSFTAASHGEVTMAVGASSTGSFTYTPTLASFVGDDSFTYVAVDTQPSPTTSGSTTVTIHVADLPSVTTLAATDIDQTAATLHGTVNAGYSDTSVAFCWGTAPDLAGCTSTAATESPVVGTVDTSVSLNLSTLTTGTTYYFRASGTNAVGSTDGAILSFTTRQQPAWTDTALGAMVVGVTFTDGVAASGVLPPTYAVTAGSLPIGLSLAELTGAISGIPSHSGAFAFTIAATNASGSINHDFTGTVDESPQWTDVVLGQMVVGALFADAVLATGMPDPTYSVTHGLLPSGVLLSATTGSITGTPLTPGGAFDFTVSATNGIGDATSHQFTGYVFEAPAWIDVTIGEVVVGTSFTDGVAASGVLPPTYAVTAGSLPIGLWLNSVTGAITGVPWVASAFTFTIAATNASGSIDHQFVGSVTLPGFVAMTPTRLLDTRDGALKYAAGSTHELLMVGRSGIPADAIAVLLSVTATESDASGFITLYPCDTARPWASNLNTTLGLTVSNAATVFVGANGGVCVYTSVATHVVIDVDGAWSATVGSGALHTFAPVRLLDSRASLGEKIAAGAVHELPVAGVGGVASDATAAVLSVTVTEPGWAGFVTVYPCGGARPWASNVNFAAGQTVSTPATSAIGALGKICFYTSAPTHLVVDVTADFSTSVGTGYPMSGRVQRLADTREVTTSTSGNRLGGGSVLHVAVPSFVQPVTAEAWAQVPTAVTLNVTVTDPASAGFATAYPCSATPPFVSNVNFATGQTVAEAATISVSASEEICVYVSVPTHVVVDLFVSFGPGVRPVS